MHHNALRTAALLGLLSGLCLVIGTLIGGQQGLIVAFGFAVLMNFVSYWFSDRIVLSMYKAQQVGPGRQLFDVVAGLSQRAGLPMPKVFVIPSESPNAFATGRNPEHPSAAATERIVRVLDQPELEGVMAHDLAHVKNRDILTSTVAATIATAIMFGSRMAQFGAMFAGGRGDDDRRGGNVFGLLATAIMAPIAAMIIQAAISRSREYAADESGAKLVGNPHGLATALRKIDAVSRHVPLPASPATAHLFIIKPFSGASLMNLFSSHPPTDERIARLLGTSPTQRG